MHIPNNLLKGSLQTIILNLLKENDRMYGYEITQKVKDITSGEIKLTEGAMYPALHKMEAEGLLETSTEQVDNRIRKYYALTSAGLEALEIKVQETTSFMENLKLLLNLKPERT
ncbi:PadR family transcriptional regulator [Pedobacter antarcticus]|uniref:PadR family transcriptional regulator n=2 Tax=Pedobacter antarcticus TaxID=34086 RepID=A0A081PCL1_9SPHI|nr:PadR family transcriptional regulator [Pedobacter antarcticus]KEQ28434.1 PadR family transcriptional regulator [Pedobacter antarcticus 4BY]SDL85823.1 DNA-binding transcriptional regulator, PadR family [Pedobacter antarcticus]SFF04099.1 DNA-binding transcriptional regulator, PadR family [Pedobacter antarcticus]